jgi:Eco57I restriction-modification methylase
MLPGLSGSLLSQHFAEHLLADSFRGKLGEASLPSAHRTFARWWREQGAHLGPASSMRAIRDRARIAIADMLGFDSPTQDVIGPGVAMVAGLWNEDLDGLWRQAVRTAIATDVHWCLCTNGHHLRLVDAQRTYSRACLDFDLPRAIGDPRTFSVLWGLLRADAFRGPVQREPLIDEIIQTSARHGAAVSRALRLGVIDAVVKLLSGLLAGQFSRKQPRASSKQLANGFDESLTLVYRVLFLMFAEARGLVPNWHPIYRAHYTIESLRDEAEQSGTARGLWETLQAIARLAHQGCRAGTLVVPAFNGRLFSPSRAPMAESCAMSDDLARGALLALSTTRVEKKDGRVRIDYRDLGVEQLGAVYESVLDYVPACNGGPKGPGVHLIKAGDRRKASGSFYTPQSITDYLVRRTLHPLAATASPAEILRLRVVDPAMGSAAFLVSACRYLAHAYEHALVRDSECLPEEIDENDRACFRRHIAQQCLYGVDLNPAAVQLARLSLWLATLAADKPLTFLDHHLVPGDSLLGVSLVDIARRPPPRAGCSRARRVDTPLFDDRDLEPSLAHLVSERRWLADTPDDKLDVVREKERRLEQLRRADQWKRLADLWCACWMWPDRLTAPEAAVFSSLSDFIATGQSALPKPAVDGLLARAKTIAETRRFFHWMLEFPELYFDDGGRPLHNPGFDAVIGNPPWDMLRDDSGCTRGQTRPDNALTRRFICESGVYRFQGRGHTNRYQLFVEKTMHLVRRGGRIGLVLPSGIATDHGSSTLRRRLLEHHDVDTLVGFENRQAIFPIHRSVRFVLCTATSGQPTRQVRCRFGMQDAILLDGIPDDGYPASAYPITLTPPLIARIAGDEMTIPDLRTATDLQIVERIVHRFSRLADASGWGAKFGRELNATDDRRHFHANGAGLPVLEGKHVEPFIVHVERSERRISEKSAAELLQRFEFKRPRLAYRDVASSTNRVSLIAAVLPAWVVTTHSLFCLKTPLAEPDQSFLCGMLNSYVSNYLVRQVMTTHLGSTTVESLRMPKPPSDSPRFKEIVELAHQLRDGPSPFEMARLQALAAKEYTLTLDDFRHILGTFPLIPEAERAAALDEFSR